MTIYVYTHMCIYIYIYMYTYTSLMGIFPNFWPPSL